MPWYSGISIEGNWFSNKIHGDGKQYSLYDKMNKKSIWNFSNSSMESDDSF